MRRLTSALILFLLYATAATAASWVSRGPIGGAVRSLVVVPTARQVIYVAEADGVFRSGDGGATWSAVTGPMVDPRVVVVSSADPNAVVAAARNGIYRSDDGGASWQAATGVPKELAVGALVSDPRDPNVIYFAGRCYISPGVFKSTDGGRTFRPASTGLSAAQRCVERFALDPAAPDHLFLWFTYQGDVYGAMKSDDGGESWSETVTAPTQSIVAAPKEGNRRFGLDLYSLLTSADGVSWSRIAPLKSDIPLGQVATLTIDPNASRLFLGTFNGAFRSGDRGYNWLALGGAARDPIRAIDFDTTSGAVVIGTDVGVFRSSGFPWNDWTDLHIGNDALVIQKLVADPVNGDAYAFSGRHLFRSSDRGVSWRETAPPLPASPLTLAVDAGHEVYASYYDGASHLVRLSAGGVAWEEVRRQSTYQGYLGLTPDPREAGVLYYASNGELSRTRDRGATWQGVPNPPGEAVVYALADPRGTDTFLCVTTAGSRPMLKKTTDGGLTWSGTKVPAEWWVFWVASTPSHPDVIYASVWPGETRASLARSVDGGETWSLLPTQPGYFDNTYAVSALPRLAIDPRDPDVVYIAMYFNGAVMVRTVDGGASWQPISEELPALVPPLLAITPDGRTLFAGTEARGVWQRDLGPRRRAAGR
jgi:photosystem II stability/assembly factor-like uncharacterized protein